jgi:hypothetical protein
MVSDRRGKNWTSGRNDESSAGAEARVICGCAKYYETGSIKGRIPPINGSAGYTHVPSQVILGVQMSVPLHPARRNCCLNCRSSPMGYQPWSQRK